MLIKKVCLSKKVKAHIDHLMDGFGKNLGYINRLKLLGRAMTQILLSWVGES